MASEIMIAVGGKGPRGFAGALGGTARRGGGGGGRTPDRVLRTDRAVVQDTPWLFC